MNEARIFTRRAPTPIHLWIVAVFSLIWNAGGAWDYLARHLGVEGYLAKLTAEQLELFAGFPWWVNVAWAVGVWFSVAGSIALLLRKRQAFWLFTGSLLGMLVTSYHNFVLHNGLAIMGTTGAMFSAVIFLVAIFLIFYSRAMVRRSVLA